MSELLDAGVIQPSKAPYSASILFQRKMDGSLRMCVDYSSLNKVIVNPMLLVQDLMDRLSKASLFSKSDVRSDYWKVHIAEGDAQ